MIGITIIKDISIKIAVLLILAALSAVKKSLRPPAKNVFKG